MTEHPEPKESAPTPYSLRDVIERAEEQRATVLAIPRLELAKVVEAWAADRTLIEHQGREIERYRKAVIKASANIIAVEGSTKTPYPDDPRWSPWTRFLERALRELGQALERPSTDTPPQDRVKREAIGGEK